METLMNLAPPRMPRDPGVQQRLTGTDCLHTRNGNFVRKTCLVSFMRKTGKMTSNNFVTRNNHWCGLLSRCRICPGWIPRQLPVFSLRLTVHFLVPIWITMLTSITSGMIRSWNPTGWNWQSSFLMRTTMNNSSRTLSRTWTTMRTCTFLTLATVSASCWDSPSSISYSRSRRLSKRYSPLRSDGLSACFTCLLSWNG